MSAGGLLVLAGSTARGLLQERGRREDVFVDPGVSTSVGAFFVLGNGSSCIQTVPPPYPRYVQNGCGVFFSVNPAAGNMVDPSKNLNVLGLIMAKEFDFRRVYATALAGSEVITYDGRLGVNPPPGFQSFVEGLPVISDYGLK